MPNIALQTLAGASIEQKSSKIRRARWLHTFEKYVAIYNREVDACNPA
jgi:hypothetical protein